MSYYDAMIERLNKEIEAARLARDEYRWKRGNTSWFDNPKLWTRLNYRVEELEASIKTMTEQRKHTILQRVREVNGEIKYNSLKRASLYLLQAYNATKSKEAWSAYLDIERQADKVAFGIYRD